MSEADASGDRKDGVTDQLGAAMDSFIQRYRRGERGLIAEYEKRHPELASRIREAFPALEMLEENSGQSKVVSALRPTTATCPEQLGEYRLIREIGRGGMGWSTRPSRWGWRDGWL